MMLMHIAAIVLFTIAHTYGIAFSINSAIFTLQNPIILLTISITIFYSLCIDLARDELQNLGYFPITNAIFLTTFTLNCLATLFSSIKKWWGIVNLLSLIFYIVHEESRLRQILYYLLESESLIQKFIFITLLFVACMGFHLGLGFIFKNLLTVERKGYSIIEQQQNSLQIDEVDFLTQIESIQNQPNQYSKYSKEQQPNNLHKLFDQYRDLPEILKAGIILVPPVIAVISLLHELSIYSSPHSHGDQHEHMYFSINRMYFQDVIPSQDAISTMIEIARVMSSATIFHYSFSLWIKKLDKSNIVSQKQMKEKFLIIFVAFLIVTSRLLAERL